MKRLKWDQQDAQPDTTRFIARYPDIDWLKQEQYVQLVHKRDRLQNAHKGLGQYQAHCSTEKKPNDQPCDWTQAREFATEMRNCIKQIDTQITYLAEHENIVTITPEEVAKLIELYEYKNQTSLEVRQKFF